MNGETFSVDIVEEQILAWRNKRNSLCKNKENSFQENHAKNGLSSKQAKKTYSYDKKDERLGLD